VIRGGKIESAEDESSLNEIYARVTQSAPRYSEKDQTNEAEGS
jgi:hypothetical protein